MHRAAHRKWCAPGRLWLPSACAAWGQGLAAPAPTWPRWDFGENWEGTPLTLDLGRELRGSRAAGSPRKEGTWPRPRASLSSLSEAGANTGPTQPSLLTPTHQGHCHSRQKTSAPLSPRGCLHVSASSAHTCMSARKTRGQELCRLMAVLDSPAPLHVLTANIIWGETPRGGVA